MNRPSGWRAPAPALRTRGYFLAVTIFPPLSVHSFSDLVGTHPWPLQPFWPPQPWPPPAHDPLPLQELIPAHFTSPPALSWPAALSPAWAAVANIAHTADAMRAPFRFFAFMFDTSSLHVDCGWTAASSTAR